MNKVCKDIFKAIHEGKWISIEYKNKTGENTFYWIGIKKVDPINRMMTVDGLNLASAKVAELYLHIESILQSDIIDGSYYQRNQYLIKDISEHPFRYSSLFNNIPNLKVLNYLAECNKLDTTPFKTDYTLIKSLDLDCVNESEKPLTDEQFSSIIKQFQKDAKQKTNTVMRLKQICMNVISISYGKSLYVLAYKRLYLDVKCRTLRTEEDITICKEFTVDGTKLSISKFLDAVDLLLLDDIDNNLEIIKDRITVNNQSVAVNDMPFVLAIEQDSMLDLEQEYSAIMDMYNDDIATNPIKAFFGDLTAKPRRLKNYPIALLNYKVNLDQLLAIYDAIKYPVVYVQGPPGSGKTNTIINTIVAAFFNEKTVLFSSYNNSPVDGVAEVLQGISYKNGVIPFPIIRLGNNEKVREAIKQIRRLYEITKPMKIYDSTLQRNKDDEIQKSKMLMELLKRYEDKNELIERKDTIKKLVETSKNLPFLFNLQSKQLTQVEKELDAIVDIKDDDAINLLKKDEQEFLKFLNYTSAKHIKHLDEPKYDELRKIIYMSDEETQITEFNRYLSNDDNLQKFTKVFPIVATTNICAHKLGKPKSYFDMVIMDEASQCNTAISLVPIIRGNQLMLVGDPQQLKPVILLDAKTNLLLKNKYSIEPEYDYTEKSVYQTFLGCDAVSDEILLSYHYRCNPKIIEFNNKKYYNDRLKIKTEDNSGHALEFVNCEDNVSDVKNTSYAEAEYIISYLKNNPQKNIGIITPFVNQKELINNMMKSNNIINVTCGTVHAFQGDEKDEILFSLAITDKTSIKTYNWVKNNKELINVATSRAKNKLTIISSEQELNKLNCGNSDDDLYELCNYVKSNGSSTVSKRSVSSRALGIKPYSSETETAFLENLNHAFSNISLSESKYSVHKEVAISQVFNNHNYNDLFYTGRFDFVVYERQDKMEYPIFAIELDGREHSEDEDVIRRDKKKNEICQKSGFQLIRIPNSYARRYNYIKDILIDFFSKSK